MLTAEQSIRATFDVFKPTGVIEVRAMSKGTWSGYYLNRDRLIEDLRKHQDKTWYFVMNQIDEACLSREQSEKIASFPQMKTTSDSDITQIDWLLIDADPRRPAGVSSTDEEKVFAKKTIGKVYRYLRNVGFATPVVCDSGNGYHLLYRVVCTVQSKKDIQRFLRVLDMLFSDERVAIDTTVFNPARITKVYGTIARKGANTKDRPHRASCIVDIPDSIQPTSITLIQKVASQLPEPERPSYRNGYAERFDIDTFLSSNNIQVHRETRLDGMRKIVLEHCPFDENHKAPDSAIFVMDNGAIAFKCFHNSCRDKRWQDLRMLYDPACYEQRQAQQRQYGPTPNTPLAERLDTEAPKAEAGNKEHFVRLRDIPDYDRSKIVSIKTGIDGLDKKIIGVNKGELSVWSGGNGSGKSTILSQVAINAVDIGFRVALFSGELRDSRTKGWLQLQAAGRQNTRQSMDGVSYYVPKAEGEAIVNWFGDKLWVYENEFGKKVGTVTKDICAAIKAHNIDVVIIDNLMSLDMTDVSEAKIDKYEKQSLLVQKLHRIAEVYNVHIHFVCHPRKQFGFLRKSDISGTANLTDVADNVFMMHRVNSDFMRLGADFLGSGKVDELKSYTNVLEIMKNRDLGVMDEFVGVYYEPQSKRLLNEPHENRVYGWEEEYGRTHPDIECLKDDLPLL